MNLSVGIAQALAASVGTGKPSIDKAKRLVRAAAYLAAQHQQRLGVAAPAIKSKGKVKYVKGPPVKGRYPFKRTGMLQASVTLSTTNIQQIVREGRIRVGLRANAFYGAVLEVRYGALGLKDTLNDLLPQLEALAGSGLQYSLVDTFLPPSGTP